MAKTFVVEIPDIGDFKNVPVIEVLVKPGDVVEKETSLITLETDKASMEVPAPQAGTVQALHVKVGDKVSRGSPIVTLELSAVTEPLSAPAAPGAQSSQGIKAGTQPVAKSQGDKHAEVVVLGAGPGGYTAAFRAADLGKRVILIERYPTLGGVCLNVGCIPSKALLHVAKIISESVAISTHGIAFSKPNIDLDQLRAWKESVIHKLTKGLSALAKQRKVEVVQGVAQFVNPHALEVATANGKQIITFDHCIIAAGSTASRIPGFPYDDPRLMDSTDALALDAIPKRLLIVGGGIIGLEMASVYHALGSQISIVELMDQLIPGVDSDLVKPLHKQLASRYGTIYLNIKVSKISAEKKSLKVTFEGDQAPAEQSYDRVLVAVGRRPNGKMINAELANVQVNERGFILVDQQMRTNVPHIFAIGDIVGEPMLAHKASYEGKLAAEVIAGHKVAFDARTIPSVAYTDPEVAWMGLTEVEAKKQGIDYEKAVFPWAASGRAIAMGSEDGLTKLLFDKTTRRILGAGIVGAHAGDLIAEAVLAYEMHADVQDLSLTIHPHPTLSETLFFAAEMAEGTITDLYIPKK